MSNPTLWTYVFVQCGKDSFLLNCADSLVQYQSHCAVQLCSLTLRCRSLLTAKHSWNVPQQLNNGNYGFPIGLLIFLLFYIFLK